MSIGEIANIPTAAAIAHAVAAAAGVRIHALPITAEKVLKALKSENRQGALSRRSTQMKNGKAQSARRIASTFKPSALSSGLIAAIC